MRHIALPLLLLLAACGADETPKPAADPARKVTVNKQALTAEQIAALEQAYRVRVMDGDYWYDRATGLWGMWGGPAAGLILAGLDLGGPLPPEASTGGTGVFVNGRELHRSDVLAVQQVVPVARGRFWMDAQGNIGAEGAHPYMNFYAAAQRANTRKNPYTTRSQLTGIGTGGDGNFSYVIGKDFSVSVGE